MYQKIKKFFNANSDAIYVIWKNMWKWAEHIARLTDNIDGPTNLRTIKLTGSGKKEN